jgi:hypothetical protein
MVAGRGITLDVMTKADYCMEASYSCKIRKWFMKRITTYHLIYLLTSAQTNAYQIK